MEIGKPVSEWPGDSMCHKKIMPIQFGIIFFRRSQEAPVSADVIFLNLYQNSFLLNVTFISGHSSLGSGNPFDVNHAVFLI